MSGFKFRTISVLLIINLILSVVILFIINRGIEQVNKAINSDIVVKESNHETDKEKNLEIIDSIYSMNLLLQGYVENANNAEVLSRLENFENEIILKLENYDNVSKYMTTDFIKAEEYLVDLYDLERIANIDQIIKTAGDSYEVHESYDYEIGNLKFMENLNELIYIEGHEEFVIKFLNITIKNGDSYNDTVIKLSNLLERHKIDNPDYKIIEFYLNSDFVLRLREEGGVISGFQIRNITIESLF